MNLRLWQIYLCCTLFATVSVRGDAANPVEFPSESDLKGAAVAPVLDTKEKRRYRSTLREAAGEGANFNGHYRLTYWGCGSNCISWAVIDLASGRVWMSPEIVESCWPRNKEDWDETAIPDWFEISQTSSAIISYSCDDTTGMFVFNVKKTFHWKDDAPVLVRREAVEY